jgi:hypothetical protein
MSNLELISKYSCLSDKTRWDVTNFEYDLDDISDNDRDIINALMHIGEGEMTGTTSGSLFFKLIFDLDRSLQIDFIDIILYWNIINIEEFRHGVVIGSLVNPDYIKDFDMNGFAEECFDNIETVKHWDAYSLIMSLCLSECTNIQLYKSAIERMESEYLKDIFNNIMNDEIRHLSAWKDLIKKLVNTKDIHKQRFMESIDLGGNIHNASLNAGHVRDSYVRGMKDTMYLWESDSIDKIVNSKYNTLKYIFGSSSISKGKVRSNHIRSITTILKVQCKV